MARIPQPPVLACLLALTLSGCSNDPEPALQVDPATAPKPSVPASPPAPASAREASGPIESAAPPLGFTCAGGHRVDIAALAATVQFADGRSAQLPRDPENAFKFNGHAMQFRMRGTRGELTQDEGSRFDCEAI